MKDNRPDPEKLLKRIQEEEKQAQRGKLKIYIGAAPGVGKTHTMLEDAFDQRSQGLDIVVGIVETHGRREIEFLLQDFEIVPRQPVEYHGQKLLEFDIDAVLKRNPAIVLIDEMAHTNVPGLRHTKRWQDIKEILDRGIDVYTTLNVQHIESLNDVVSQIIHTRVKETIPDFMLDLASNIELVDLPPEDLLKRLQAGKVYFPAQAEIAREHFFLKGNLIALRELALRVTAERVSKQVLLYRQGLGIKYIWPTKEKLLVCISHNPSSSKLIRVASRLANRLTAEWIAIHVDSPQAELTEEQKNNVIQNLRLAEKLGAETQIITGINIIHAIMNFAREQNVTEIIIWKHIRPRWKEFFSRSLADEIVRNSGEIDIYVVTSEKKTTTSSPLIPRKKTFSFKAYLIMLGMVTLTTAISLFLFPYVQSTRNLIMIYLIGVTAVAALTNPATAIIASILSILSFNFFFIPPYYELSIGNIESFFTLVAMLLVAITISKLSTLNRRQTEMAQIKEKHTASLHTLSRKLASTRGVDKLLDTAVHYVAEAFNSEVMVLLPDNGQLIIKTKQSKEKKLSDKELSVAAWVYDLGQMAGLGTDTLPFSEALYIPLLATQSCIGVLRLHPKKTKQLFSPEQIHLLEECASQIALAIEVDRLHDQTQQTELLTETEQVRNKLLQSVSHSLRSPLVTVMGAANTLLEMANQLDRKKIKKLANQIYIELEQLNRLINNLLQITYLEAESINLQKQYFSLNDTVDSVIRLESNQLANRIINVAIPADFPLVPFDNTLIKEVLINLLDNAIQFTPDDTLIDISAFVDKDKAVISIEDYGPGIVPDEVNHLFEKFYRGRMLTSKRGLGLGLAICRSIVNAHGGLIWAENKKDGGAAFRFTLPLSM